VEIGATEEVGKLGDSARREGTICLVDVDVCTASTRISLIKSIRQTYIFIGFNSSWFAGLLRVCMDRTSMHHL